MSLIALWLWCSVVYLANTQNTSDVTCESTFYYTDVNSTINITQFCKQRVCITKCCPENKMFFNHETDYCVDREKIKRFFNVHNLDAYADIYEKNIKQEVKKARRSLKDFTRIYSNNPLTCSHSMFPPPKYHLYILEEGSLAVRQLNYLNQWEFELSPGEFCVEDQVILDDRGNVSMQPQLVIKIFATKRYAPNISNLRNTVTACGLVVSCVFLILVLAVYALLPGLRNMAGLILMSYVTTFAAASLFRAVQVFVSDNLKHGTGLPENTCLFIGLTSFYTILATFTWMNVMSFDIWWSMRGFRKLRQIHRRGVRIKLGWYGLYGWGAPLLPVIFMLVVENIDMTHLPNFVTPHILDSGRCYIGEDERLLYMNGPISIAIFVNITLFVMTVYNIWRIRHDVSQHAAGESRRNATEETRFIVYLKLALVMGINWIWEVVSPLYDRDSEWWYIPDVFNSLTGVFIFLIFVCKRNIFVLLCQRFSIENEFVRKSLDMDSSRNKRKVPDTVTDASDVNEIDIRK